MMLINIGRFLCLAYTVIFQPRLFSFWYFGHAFSVLNHAFSITPISTTPFQSRLSQPRLSHF
jgi:hypothetical protein